MVHLLTDGKLLTETCTFELGGLRQSSARRLQVTAFSDVLACATRYPRRADSTPVPFYTLMCAKSIAKFLKSRENDQQTEKISIRLRPAVSGRIAGAGPRLSAREVTPPPRFHRPVTRAQVDSRPSRG
jgi:hypothetical protein